MARITIKVNGEVVSLSAKSDAMYAVVKGKLYVRDRVSGNIKDATTHVTESKKQHMEYLSSLKKLEAQKKKVESLPKGSPARKAAKNKYDWLKVQMQGSKERAVRALRQARTSDLSKNAGLSGLMLPFTTADLKSNDLKAINKHKPGTFAVRGSDVYLKPTFVKWDKLMTLMGHDPAKLKSDDKAREKRKIEKMRREGRIA